MPPRCRDICAITAMEEVIVVRGSMCHQNKMGIPDTGNVFMQG
jgi:hypothetical protein